MLYISYKSYLPPCNLYYNWPIIKFCSNKTSVYVTLQLEAAIVTLLLQSKIDLGSCVYTWIMQNLILLLVTTAAVGYVSAVNIGPFTIIMNGQPQTKYVLSDDAARKCCVQANRTSITLSGGGHIYFGESSTNTFSPNSFYQMNLFGKRLTFDVDMSGVGCNCNGALYLVSMPAYVQLWTTAPTWQQ